MTPDQLAALKLEVNGAADLAGSLIGAIDPALIPFVLLGKGAAALAPDLLNDAENIVANLKAGADPSQSDNDALAVKIAAFERPETI